MEKIQLLQERKAKLENAVKEIRNDIQAIIDEGSFVELSAFSFSKNDFYNESVAGEGVVTGFATLDGYPFYIVAQNYKVCDGGMSKANCDKIVKCLDLADKNRTPVIYLLNTHGVQVGEGVTVLEGLGNLLLTCVQNNHYAPQYVVVNGDVYGSAALLASIADFSFFVEKKSVLAVNSPFVLSAKAGKNVGKDEVGSANALKNTGLPSFEVKDLSEVRGKILALKSLAVEPIIDAELNEALPELNECANADKMLSVFESYIELNATYEPQVKTVLGRIGGISVAAILFDGGEDGVELDAGKFAKLKDFVDNVVIASSFPLITFANVKGIAPCMGVNNSRALKEAASYLKLFEMLDTPKIAVVYKKAIGLGYSLFASKSIGFDYTCAFANAKIALFDSVQGAQIEMAGESIDQAALAARYADENSDPVHAAKDGYIDAIIEPQFVKQYLISALQMLAE